MAGGQGPGQVQDSRGAALGEPVATPEIALLSAQGQAHAAWGHHSSLSQTAESAQAPQADPWGGLLSPLHGGRPESTLCRREE